MLYVYKYMPGIMPEHTRQKTSCYTVFLHALHTLTYKQHIIRLKTQNTSAKTKHGYKCEIKASKDKKSVKAYTYIYNMEETKHIDTRRDFFCIMCESSSIF